MSIVRKHVYTEIGVSTYSYGPRGRYYNRLLCVITRPNPWEANAVKHPCQLQFYMRQVRVIRVIKLGKTTTNKSLLDRCSQAARSWCYKSCYRRNFGHMLYAVCSTQYTICHWQHRKFTRVFLPQDGSAGVKYIRKSVLLHCDRLHGLKLWP